MCTTAVMHYSYLLKYEHRVTIYMQIFVTVNALISISPVLFTFTISLMSKYNNTTLVKEYISIVHSTYTVVHFKFTYVTDFF